MQLVCNREPNKHAFFADGKSSTELTSYGKDQITRGIIRSTSSSYLSEVRHPSFFIQHNYVASNAVDVVDTVNTFVSNLFFSPTSAVNRASDIVVDPYKIKNYLLLQEISELEDDWDGYGASRIPEECINISKDIVEVLPIQPLISPTGRNTIYMQYDLSDKSFLGFEVGSSHVTMLRIYKADYANAYQENITFDKIMRIKQEVASFYGSDIY